MGRINPIFTDYSEEIVIDDGFCDPAINIYTVDEIRGMPKKGWFYGVVLHRGSHYLATIFPSEGFGVFMVEDFDDDADTDTIVEDIIKRA